MDKYELAQESMKARIDRLSQIRAELHRWTIFDEKGNEEWQLWKIEKAIDKLIDFYKKELD